MIKIFDLSVYVNFKNLSIEGGSTLLVGYNILLVDVLKLKEILNFLFDKKLDWISEVWFFDLLKLSSFLIVKKTTKKIEN